MSSWFHHCRMYALISCLLVAIAPWGAQAAPPPVNKSVTVTGTVCVNGAFQPVITKPLPGAQTTAGTVFVSGTAVPTEVIRIRRNGTDVGSTVSSAEGKWEITVSLVMGNNVLVAEGCYASNPVTVKRLSPPQQPKPRAPGQPSAPQAPNRPGQPAPSQPVPAPVPNAPSTPIRPISNPVVITAPDSQLEAVAGEEMGLIFAVSGGNSPYDYTISWGDGSESADGLDAARQLAVNHTYAKAGRYLAGVTVRDALGGESFYGFVVTVTDSPAVPGVTQAPQKPFPWAAVWKISLILLLLILWEILHRRHKKHGQHDCKQHLMRPFFRAS